MSPIDVLSCSSRGACSRDFTGHCELGRVHCAQLGLDHDVKVNDRLSVRTCQCETMLIPTYSPTELKHSRDAEEVEIVTGVVPNLRDDCLESQ
jgi:hypothetical protein